nr:retrovirus-related Pol polyprotein from transposon TNT 1-94 [Tanacetum cinerariifolium]
KGDSASSTTPPTPTPTTTVESAPRLHEEGKDSDESDEGSNNDSDKTVKFGAGKDDDDDDDNDEDEELAKNDEEDKETGKGGDEVRESEGESEEETREEEDKNFDPIPRTPEESEEESNDEEEQESRLSEEARIQEEEDADELYRDVNINQGRGLQVTQNVEDTHMTLTPVNPDGPQESSSMSSFVSSMLNPISDVGVESIFTTTSSPIVSLETPTPIMTPYTIATITTSGEAPIPPPTIPSIILENLPTFNSAFRFEERLSANFWQWHLYSFDSGNNLHWQWELILLVGTLTWQWECLVHFIPNMISSGMFRINPFKPSREEKYVPNKVRASVRTNPITVSQCPVITKKVINSDSNGLSSTGVDNTDKTRRPQPRSNTKNDRVPSVSKSSCSKNKEVEVEENPRNLLLSKNKKHMSSECNNVKLATLIMIFDTINDLAKNNLVTGLPKFKYHKEHLCPSCEQGKSKRASHPPKPVSNSRQRLHLLHMDLCGPMRIASINEKRVGISHQVSSVRTRQQNGLVERRNQTLVEAARTMLIFSRALLFLWAEAIATACFTQNRSIIHRRFNKTPYELINERKPDISFLHVFEALCYPKNDREDIGKLGAKGDIGFFIGYSADSCAYRVYNQRTKKIIERMNVTFDELSAMVFDQSSELDFLFEAMYDDYIGGQPSAAPRTVLATQAHQNVKEAMTDPTWIDSMQEALLQFKRLDLWVLVPTPDNNTPLTLKWLLKNKHDEENTFIQNKSRLVVRGYRQEEGIDFEESFAPLELGISTSLLKFPAIKPLAIKRWDEYGFVIHP